MKKAKWFLISLVLACFVFLPSLAQAKTDSIWEGKIYLGPEEVINDNFVRFGETVEVLGQVDGDVIVGGSVVNINSDIGGDVLAFGGDVNVKGNVAGNVRVIGVNIKVAADVGRNLNLFGNAVTVQEETKAAWSFAFGANKLVMDGQVGGNMDGWSSQATMGGQVGGNTNFYLGASGTAHLTSTAAIGGSLTYQATNTNQLKNEGEVKGETTHKSYTQSTWWQKQFKQPVLWGIIGLTSLFFKVVSLFSLLVVGLVIIFVWKKRLLVVTERMWQKPGPSLGWGLVYLVVSPIVLFVLAFTLIGLPLTIIGLVIYCILLYLTSIFVGLAIGQKILEKAGQKKKKKEVSLLWSMILGVVIYSIILSIPVLGWIIHLLGALWALGAIGEVKKQAFQEKK